MPRVPSDARPHRTWPVRALAACRGDAQALSCKRKLRSTRSRGCWRVRTASTLFTVYRPANRPRARATRFDDRSGRTDSTRSRSDQKARWCDATPGLSLDPPPRCRRAWPSSQSRGLAVRPPADQSDASERSRDPLTSGGGGESRRAPLRHRTPARARYCSRRPHSIPCLARRRAQAAERLVSIQISTSRLMFGGIRSCGNSRSTVSGGNFSSSSHRPPWRIVSRMGRRSSGAPSMSTARLPRSHVQIFTRRAI